MKKYYFASDFHLGMPDYKTSLEREKLLVKWLDTVKQDAAAIYLLGDIFDFWHEWTYVVPKGFVRFLGKLAEITDLGIPVHYFTGNHDIWAYKYMADEIGVHIYRKPAEFVIEGKKFYLAHGDGLGPDDVMFKFLKFIFTNKCMQWAFAKLHPNWAMAFGNNWSKSRKGHKRYPEFFGEKEWLVIHSRNVLKKNHFDYFMYGHRHLPMILPLGNDTSYVNLGDWVRNNSYVVFDGNSVELKYFQTER